MFTFDDMILFDKSAKSQVSKDASSSSSSLAGSAVSSVGKKSASDKFNGHKTIPKISSNSFKSKVSPAGTVRSSTSKLSKFVPPRRVAKSDSDQERKDILKELISSKPKPKNKLKFSAKHKDNTAIGKKPIKPIVRKPEQVDAKLAAQTVQVEPAKVMIKTSVLDTTAVTSVSVTKPETNRPVATKSKPVEVLSGQSENIEYENVDSSKTKADSQANKSPNNKTKEYKCEKCQETFSYLKRYNDHERKGQCNTTITCTQCGVTFRNAKNLKRHIRRIHEKPMYKCGDCGKIFPSEKTVNKHYISHHVPHMCDLCKKVFKNANTLRSHVFNCKKATKVPPTNETNRDEKGLGTDEAIKDNETSNSETKETETKTKQTKKQISKPKPKLFIKECSQCNKRYQSRSGYIKHMKTHKMAKEDTDNQEVIILDENILKAIEDTGEADFIVQEHNSQNVLVLV